MADDAPPVLKLSERRRYPSAMPRPHRLPQDYSSMAEYFRDVVEPELRAAAEPEVAIGYADLKRRR